MQKEVKMKFSSTQYLYFDHYDMLSIVTSESSVNFIFVKSQIYTEDENFCTIVDKEFFILALKRYVSTYKEKSSKYTKFVENHEKIFIDNSYDAKFSRKYHTKKYEITNFLRKFADFTEALELCFNEQSFLKKQLKPIINELKIYKDELKDNLSRLYDIHAHIISLRNDRITKDIYILTLASTIFLPLNLVTGFFWYEYKWNVFQ
ncbi:CorA family divalent cation transporter [Campylobacter sputorum]|uniref:CorA family divalent cation transporter n=1 Tax=Campylobacter sputorum TaxID=206 RepID=UPI00068C1E51|nr:CorA family divalent cation transporter [Campylobacter sputorum]